MSQLFNQICQFYGANCSKASFTDLCFLASDIGRSLVDGSAIEVKSSDGFVNRSKRIKQVSRLDTIACLGKLAALLEKKLEALPKSELEHLDRIQQMIAGASGELPKRLNDPNL
ncbi:hypothetical protein H6F51_24720 [Cyanobacteria bacterium FACHB-DQ100]|nr:hypothetical protein [Cyanobacteria bacterium FACHB-DQ100]